MQEFQVARSNNAHSIIMDLSDAAGLYWVDNRSMTSAHFAMCWFKGNIYVVPLNAGENKLQPVLWGHTSLCLTEVFPEIEFHFDTTWTEEEFGHAAFLLKTEEFVIVQWKNFEAFFNE